jgi:DNA-binding NarL/FixJ family response regulator
VPEAKHRCLLIGHQLLLLDGLRNLLEPEFEVLAVAADYHAAFAAAEAFCPEVAVIDADAGEVSREIGLRLRETHPALVTTYLTSKVDPWSVEAVVSKTRPASELLRTVRMGCSQYARVAPLAARRSPPTSQRGIRSTANLSNRELQVLVLLVRGLPMKKVALELGITPRTVAFHKYKAMEANGLRTNADLVSFALRHDILARGSNRDSLATMAAQG